ncbi:MAG: hypothetical protein JO336_25205 [Acidobacteriia bacterium]|nr:hypothetical protein [Terriglobia bacterium]MBV8906346.1 hypothetical protein [Terriglobia bacterium]
MSLVLGWGGTALLAVILGRMARERILVRFPYFSAYLGAVLASSVLLICFEPSSSHAYLVAYWISEFVTAALSFGIAWEGYAKVLAPYPGMRKMARSILGIVFLSVGTKSVVGLSGADLRNRIVAIGEFESDLRLFEALSLLALVALVVHYRIPVGRNVVFMISGYALYLGIRVASLNVLLDLGLIFRPWLNLLLQCAWNSAAALWCVGMWSYAPAREPVAPIESDYERNCEETIRALGELREYVVESWRSL